MSREVSPDFISIHRSFAATELGEILASRVRYEPYKPAEVNNFPWPYV